MDAEEIAIISGLPPEQAAALANMPEGSKFDFKQVLGGNTAALTDGALTFSLPRSLVSPKAISQQEIAASQRILEPFESSVVIKKDGTWRCAKATLDCNTTVWYAID